MRKILKSITQSYILLFCILITVSIIILPLIFTQKFILDNSIKQINVEAQKDFGETIDYGVKYKTINLLHRNDNTVETIELEEYLVNVLAAEMPVDYELEALKAQATVARTYTLYQIENGKKHENSDMCDSSECCQAWVSKEKRFESWKENQEEKWNKLREAVYSCSGDIITYNGKPIDAFFHSNSGGKTELPVNVWGGTDYPYLQAVETSGEDEYTQYYSEIEYTKTEIEEKMKNSYEDFSINWQENNCIEILEYTEGERIKTIKIGNKNIAGVEARKIFSLRSSNFTFEISETGVKFKVIGYGHGVGLSQTGSNTLAKEGKNYIDIINHFYQNVEIENIK